MKDNEIITDEQIIKALEEHIRLRNLGICEPDTPLHMLILLLDLINRQKAEIEYWKERYERTMDNLKAILEERGDNNE